MKNRFIIAWIWALGVSVLAGCDIETSDNGDLDGMWRLESVDTLASGGRL